MKTCNQCGEVKPFSEYYFHKGTCKPCYRVKVKAEKRANKEHYRAYDKARPRRQSPGAERRRSRQYRANNPEKVEAHAQTNAAIRDGDLVRQPCEQCGELKVDAHHDDYSKPLVVRWLCRSCHNEHHRQEKNDYGQ